MTLPVVRFLVDWDDDGFACRGVQASDPLNVSDNALFKHIVSARVNDSADASSVLSNVAIDEEFGIVAARCEAGISYGGIGFGLDYVGATPTTYADGIWAVSASTTYTVSIWVKAENSFNQLIFSVRDQDGNGIVGSNPDPANDGAWHRYDKTFTTGVGDTGVVMYLINDGTGFPADRPIFQVTGFMIVAGSTAPTGLNVGDASNKQDDITANVEGCDWQSGRSNPEEVLFAEGTASFTLDNTDKKYSPEYASSPLFGYIKPNLRCTVEVQNPSTSAYIPMWTGWTEPIQPETSEYGAAQAHMQAVQGKFRLDNLTTNFEIQSGLRSDQVVDKLIKGGWYSANNPLVTILDRSLLGVNTYLSDLDDQRNTENGATTFGLVGENWISGQTTLTSALHDVMSVEQGYMWIGRDGKLNFRSRDYYHLNGTPDYTLSIDTQLNDGEYHYGDNVFNKILVDYYPKATEEDAVIWISKGLELPSNDQKTLTAKLELEDASKVTATSVNPFIIGSAPSTILAVSASGKDFSTKVSASVKLKNGQILVDLRNTTRQTLTVTVTVRGNKVTSYGNLETEVVDEASIAANGLFEYSKLAVKEVVLEETAIDIGNYIVGRFADPQGYFTSVSVASRDSTWLQRLLGIGIGSLLRLSETQTSVTNRDHIVVGEKMTWQPGILRATYVLRKQAEAEAWILGLAGRSELGTTTRLGY